MKEPSVVTSLYDADYNVTYDVVAFRTLTTPELKAAVQAFRAQPKIMQRVTPLRNKTIRIATRIGALILLTLVTASCSSQPKAGPPRTQQASDSVLGESRLPGASVVKKANAVRDSAEARRAAEDTIGENH